MIDPNELQRRGAYVLSRYPFVVAGIAVVTVILTFISGWYLLVGLIALLAFAYFATANMNTTGAANSAPPSLANTSRLDLNRLTGKYHESMEQALQRRVSIERMIAEASDPGMRRALTESTHDLPELTNTIYELACKAQSVQTALDSSNTMNKLAVEIERLDQSIKSTNDEFQKSQYYASLDGKLQQMQNLTDTKVALERWDAQIDNALSAMDTILSQVTRMQSSEILSYSGATDNMSHSLREQVEQLKATSDALDTVYGGSK